MNCPSCHLFLPPGDTSAHLLRFHSGRLEGHWACGRCRFADAVFSDALTHGLLQGHDVTQMSNLTSSARLFSKQSVCSSILGTFSQEIEHPQLLFHSTIAQSSIMVSQNGPTDQTTSSNKVLYQSTASHETYDHDQITSQKDIIEQQQRMTSDHENVEDCPISEPDPPPVPDAFDESDELDQLAQLAFVDSEQPAQSEAPDPTPVASEAEKLWCSRCGRGMVVSSGKTKPAVSHASGCLGIRPFACSVCGHKVSVRHRIRQHMKKDQACASASVLTPNREENVAKIRAALALCFPHQSFNWGGIPTTQSLQDTEIPTMPRSTAETDDECETEEMTPQSGNNPLIAVEDERKVAMASECETEETASESGSNHFNATNEQNKEAANEMEDMDVDVMGLNDTTNEPSKDCSISDTVLEKIATKELQTTNGPLPVALASADKEHMICCTQCGKSLYAKKRSARMTSALSHVSLCLHIHPYACSLCGHQVPARGYMRYHTKEGSTCASASITVPEREQNEQKIREGLSLCFPNQSFNWKGLPGNSASTTEESVNPACDSSEHTIPEQVSVPRPFESEAEGVQKMTELETVEETDESDPADTETPKESSVTENQAADDEHESSNAEEVAEVGDQHMETESQSVAGTEKTREDAVTEGQDTLAVLSDESKAVNPTPLQENENDAEMGESIVCARCERCLRFTKKIVIVNHVNTCLDIRPFGCTNCSHRVNSRDNFRHHKRPNGPCADAELTIPDRVDSEQRIKTGLTECFPNQSIAWTGFTANDEASAENDKTDAQSSETDTQSDPVQVSTTVKSTEEASSEQSEEVGSLSQYNREDLASSLSQYADEEVAGHQSRITCAHCKSSLSRSSAIRHVTSCLGITPFSCSGCQRRFSRKTNFRRHKTSTCPSAELNLVDKERDELRIREALDTCFPDVNVNFNGLQ